ncbi:hypothetical protein EOM39_01545 [Candidatus Gracilibacteria bacterium]|nr:hypothetical protein [Candidatus Gracilibacteria bacterium]
METIYNKETIYDLLKNNFEQEAVLLIKQISYYYINYKKDTQGLYNFFNSLYDDLFYDITFNKIIISKKTIIILEELATPISSVRLKSKEEYIKKLLGI